MFAALIDERGDGSAGKIVYAAAYEGEALFDQIFHGGRKIDPSVKPWFYGMSICGDYVAGMAGHHGVYVSRH